MQNVMQALYLTRNARGLPASARRYTLLDIPCYKILMGCDGKNLQETKDLYNLTDAEQELLESKRRGHALFIIGSKRLHVNFEIPAYKFSYMGKAGGR